MTHSQTKQANCLFVCLSLIVLMPSHLTRSLENRLMCTLSTLQNRSSLLAAKRAKVKSITTTKTRRTCSPYLFPADNKAIRPLPEEGTNVVHSLSLDVTWPITSPPRVSEAPRELLVSGLVVGINVQAVCMILTLGCLFYTSHRT